MKARRPSLTARAIGLLDRMTFAVEALGMFEPRASDPAVPKTVEPSTRRLAEEARALVTEYRGQHDR